MAEVQPIAWYQYGAITTGTPNGAPTLATDGVETLNVREVHYLFEFSQDEQSSDPFSGRVWVRYNGVWARINTFDLLCCFSVSQHSICGVLPVYYPERVYLEVCEVGELDDVKLHVGCTVPGWLGGRD